jgi:hypothetical protein
MALGLVALALVGWRATAWFTTPPPEEPAGIELEQSAGTGQEEPPEERAPEARATTSLFRQRITTAQALPPVSRLSLDPFRSYPAPAPPAEEQASEPPPTALASDSFRLEGLALGPGPPLAMINGKVVGIGDVIAGARVTTIDRQGVVLDVSGYALRLTLNDRLDLPARVEKEQ